MVDNTIEAKKYLEEIIQELYAIELIFQDFKRNELKINDNDEKFIIPYRLRRERLKDDLKCAYDKELHFNRIYNMIILEAKKTLENNSQNIDKLKKYAWNLALV